MSQLHSVAQRTERKASGGPSYIWEAPGKPVAVRLPLELIDRLEREAVENFRSIEAKGSEIGGLLYGSASAGSPAQIAIEEYEMVPCDYSRGPLYRLSETDLARFDEAAERRNREQGLQVVGFFRSHTRKGLGLDADDLTVIEAHFGDPLQIALLVRPFATKASGAGIFIWEDGKMRSEASYLEFPFQSSQLASRAVEAPPAKPAAPAAPAPARVVARAQVVPMTSRLKIAATPGAPSSAAAPAAPPAPAQAAATPVAAPPMQAKPSVQTPTPVQAKPSVQAPAPVQAARPPAQLPTPVQAKAVQTPAPAKPSVPAPVQAKASVQTPAPAAKPPVQTKTPETARPEPPAAAAKPERPTEIAFAAAQEAPSRLPAWLVSKKWLVIAAAAVFLACSGALFIYPGMAHRSGSAANPAAIPFALHVDRTATDLVLSWNRESEAIRNARHAVLSISDGERQENVEMNLADLRNGTVQYTPVTGDTSFRMEITGPNGSKTATESVRVLRSKPSAMPTPDGKQQAAAKNEAQPNAAASPETPVQEPAAPAPKRELKTFNAESLAQRLHSSPAAAETLDAPVLSASASPASTNFSFGEAPAVPLPAPAAAKTAAPVQSVVTEAKLVNRVDPQLSPTLRRLSGPVRVLAVIGKDGKIKTAKAISGPNMLYQATVDAVLRWVYTPTLLNGNAVEVEKEIVVNYSGR